MIIMDRFKFWQQWLFISCILFALFGVAFSLLGNTLFFKSFNAAYATVFWNSKTFPGSVSAFVYFTYGSFGSTITCCYILLAFIVYHPFRRKEKWAYYAIITAFSVWVIIDSSICMVYKVYFQIYLINVFSIFVKALPLIFTRKYFF
jgi:hypothetical protein